MQFDEIKKYPFLYWDLKSIKKVAVILREQHMCKIATIFHAQEEYFGWVVLVDSIDKIRFKHGFGDLMVCIGDCIKHKIEFINYEDVVPYLISYYKKNNYPLDEKSIMNRYEKMNAKVLKLYAQTKGNGFAFFLNRLFFLFYSCYQFFYIKIKYNGNYEW